MNKLTVVFFVIVRVLFANPTFKVGNVGLKISHYLSFLFDGSALIHHHFFNDSAFFHHARRFNSAALIHHAGHLHSAALVLHSLLHSDSYCLPNKPMFDWLLIIPPLLANVLTLVGLPPTPCRLDLLRLTADAIWLLDIRFALDLGTHLGYLRFDFFAEDLPHA
jgi:hypothetical protein